MEEWPSKYFENDINEYEFGFLPNNKKKCLTFLKIQPLFYVVIGWQYENIADEILTDMIVIYS